ncbi:TPA: hypothetical protein LR805_004803 [Salmonella enterica subsp. enterica serovar Typhimurium]|nr:hypothetical protein [Salmonella enterica subsp. enterica serovar Typhimurium]
MTTENTVVSVREAATAEIKVHLDTIGTAYLKVGSLLNELRGDFENQRDFLSYVEAEFSIKKAQCYNLMNVARCFDGDERFKGVAMRVMLALIPFADDGAIMDKAAGLAANGELDTKAVNALVSPSKPVKAEASQSQAEDTKAAEKAAPVESEALQSVPHEVAPEGDESAPWEDAPATTEAAAPKLDNAENTENAAMASLLAQIKTLTEQLTAANDRIAELTSTRETKKAAAPMLPQFKSKCFYARLGLSAEEAEKKTAVNKAKRELVKLGYGEGHEAWDLIQEAVTALTEK